MSPPRLTSTPPPATRALARAAREVGGERLRGRAEVELDAGGDAHDAARVVELDAAPAGGAREAHRGARPGSRAKSRS